MEDDNIRERSHLSVHFLVDIYGEQLAFNPAETF
jgi:hypothetical protein